ncbi:unnamed protein product [Phytophthora fragariaefolia]|uniref:Unnamed protein product n=1 Tax=Phytophthora fragariaefolia TaxID=1490495 RepID=A0A9W7D0J4_9STRA|nr:unnamed protein product [Phytophthora fragariaefolia]
MGHNLAAAAAIAFLALQLSQASADVVAYDWRLTPIMTAFDGVRLQTLGVNGKPSNEAVIEVKLGQDVEVHVTNQLAEATCLHWHGMKQLGTQEMDGMSGFTQCAIEPNTSATYRYTPDKAGTSGGIVTTAPSTHGRHLPRAATGSCSLGHDLHQQLRTLQLHRGSFAQPHGLQPDAAAIAFDFVPGRKYLLRLIMAMGAFEFSIDDHEFQVIAAGTEPVVPTKLLNSIVINVGQRYDIIVQAKEEARGVGSFWMRAKGLTGYPWTARTASTGTAGFNDEGLAIISYDPANIAEPTSQEAKTMVTIGEFDFVPADPVALPIKPEYRTYMRSGINVTLGTGIVSIDGGEFYSLVVPDEPPLLSIASGVSAVDLPATANARAIGYGDHVEVVLMNDVLEQHPFHLHSHVAWVVGSGHASAKDVYSNNLHALKLEGVMVRDVYTVPPCTINEKAQCVDVGYVVLRFKADNPGLWMMHCHIEWHMSVGMGMIYIEGETELQTKGPSASSKSLLSVCKSTTDTNDEPGVLGFAEQKSGDYAYPDEEALKDSRNYQNANTGTKLLSSSIEIKPPSGCSGQ